MPKVAVKVVKINENIPFLLAAASCCQFQKSLLYPLYLFIYLFFSLFAFSRATAMAYGGSQAMRQMGAVSRQPTPQPQQHGIWAASTTYTTAHGNAVSLTH